MASERRQAPGTRAGFINKILLTYKMQLTYRFRLYPTKEQEQTLLFTLDKCRFVYNKLLEELNKQEKINRNELQHSILKIKQENKGVSNIYSKVLQYENYRLFSNLRALSRLKKKGKKVGRLRFKGKEWFKTFTYNQSGFKLINTEKRYQILHLSKIGDILIRGHRNIKEKIKQITIKKEASGKWFASITAENNDKIVKTQNNKKIGIDLGIINYVYDSNGNHFDNPKSLNKSLEKLTKAQKKLAKKKKGSDNRIKQKIKLAIIHERITNQRNDFMHKLSRYYINNYILIAIENLNIKGLINLSYNAKNIMDASWSRFIQMLEYKAERAGVQIAKIEPRGTTQTCSNCGTEVHKELWNRIHKCSCGLEINRDYNSAKEILNRALVRQDLSEFKPMEIKPLLIHEQADLGIRKP